MSAFKTSIAAALTGAALLCSSQAWAGSVIDVSLWDKGGDAAMATDLAYGSKGDMSKQSMGIDVTPTKIPAGHVTFEVVNNSRDLVHEMVVSPLKPGEKALPYIQDEYRVDEDKAGHLGEVSELDPGKTGELGIDLKPGKYIVYCNIPGHFAGGMWTVLEVTKQAHSS
jgi:uncharacterized cupredoxin-like copper-binding protein